MSEGSSAETVETPEDIEKDGEGIVRRWLIEIKLYEKQAEDWHKTCDKVREKLRCDKDKGKRFNAYWSTLQTLEPAVHSLPPNVEIQRRHKDRNPVALAASEILERATQYGIDAYDVQDRLLMARNDYLRYGRGQVWLRYVPEIQKATRQVLVNQSAPGAPVMRDDGQPFSGSAEDLRPAPDFEMTGNMLFEEEYEEVVYEECAVDYIHLKDFGHTNARVWEEVKAVWRRVFMTREELIDRFGEEKGRAVDLNYLGDKAEKTLEYESDKDLFKKAVVYEIWDKSTGKVLFISAGYKKAPLETTDDPLNLKDFFPCPRPAYGTLTSESLIPIPDYQQGRTQLEELDDLTDRINGITESVMFKGLGNGSMTELTRLANARDGEIVQVENWLAFAQKGGLKGNLDFWPIEQIAGVLRMLYDTREQAKQTYYEVSGMSDLMRGATDPRETATAQRLKGQFGSIRLRDKQSEFQRFVRDVIAIKAEIIAEQYQPQTLALVSGVEAMGQEFQQIFPKAVALLKDEPIRNYQIDIETDSTIVSDEQADKESAREFVTALGSLLKESLPILANAPEWTPVFGEAINMVSRRYRAGRTMENDIEKAVEATVARAQQAQQAGPGQQGPDPRAIEAMQRQQIEQAKLAQRGQKDAAELQLKQAVAGAELDLKRAELAQDGAIAERKIQADMAVKAADIEAEQAMKAREQLVNLNPYVR